VTLCFILKFGGQLATPSRLRTISSNVFEPRVSKQTLG
jgi:hypothetical protein